MDSLRKQCAFFSSRTISLKDNNDDDNNNQHTHTQIFNTKFDHYLSGLFMLFCQNMINGIIFHPKTLSEIFLGLFLRSQQLQCASHNKIQLTMIKNTVSNGNNVLIKENNSSRFGQKPRESVKLPTT